MERENAQALQARVTGSTSTAKQQRVRRSSLFPQPTVSPFTVEQKKGSPPPQAIAGRIVASGTPMVSSVIPAAAPDQERMREQMKASMERQQALLRDPEYREAMLTQQKMSERQANPNLARDLNLTAEQADRFFTALAERQLRSMETNSPMMWSEQPDPAKMQELQRKMTQQQSANEAELKRVLGDAKFREWQEYQSLAGVRWEAGPCAQLARECRRAARRESDETAAEDVAGTAEDAAADGVGSCAGSAG